jgi:TM2 domain-containing membrane protein YozV
MKRCAALLILVAVTAALFAEGPLRGDPFATEVRDILSGYRDRAPADLTFGEIEELAAALSVPAQKSAYVRKSSVASMVVPGLGQFMNGDPLAGSLFLLGDLTVTIGTTVGLYFLLPPELRFDQLDYFNTSYTDIHAAWETAARDATVAQTLPFWGVASGGMILKHIVAHVSARHAARLAVSNIERGEITFEPRAGFLAGFHGRPGIGFGLRY